MKTTLFPTRSAPIAIAALAALSFTPVLAQDAAPQTPVIVLPETEPAATAPAPVELPEAPITATTSAPGIEAEPVAPEAAMEEPAPAERRPEPRQADPMPASIPETPVSSGDAATAATDVGVDAELFSASPPVEAAPALNPAAPEPAPIEDNSSAALLLALLASLVIAGAVLLAVRSRRRPGLEPERIEKPVIRRMPLAPAPAAPAFHREPLVSSINPAVAAASPVAAPGAAVALPRELPRSFEERDSLLKRMIAARPDRANPFRSRPARARRARLILQSLGRKFDKVEPRIDLSQYTEVWPALRGRQPATA